MENLLIPFFGIGLGLGFMVLFFFSSRRRSKLPPGPWRLPILGNLHQLGPLPHRSLCKLAAKHGPLMHLHLGKIPTIIVSSPDLAFQILKTLDLSFASRPSSSSGAEFTYGGKLGKYSEHWRQVRKLGTLEIFSMKRVQSFRSIREEEINLLIKTIHRISSSSSDVNLSKLFVIMSNNITSKEAFGKRFSDDGDCNWSPEHDICKEVIELLGEFSLREMLPSLELFRRSSKFRVKLEKSFKRMDQLFEREIDGHCSGDGGGDDGEKDLLDVLLKHLGDSSFGFAFTRDDIKAILQEIFFGGTDTTSSVLEWVISELVRNPRVMNKAQDEVRGSVGPNKGKVEESDLQELRYLKLVINETLRLHPPAPLLVPRECREECNVQGYDIPVGTSVFVNVWAIMRDPNSWENPEEFIPERFEESPINFKGQHFQFIPFGAGRRMCPGMQLGIAIIEIALANILYHFNWELPSGADMDMSETVTVVLHKKSPLILKAIPRINLV